MPKKKQEVVKKVEVSYSNVVDVLKEDSEIVQVNVAAEAVDDAVDKVIASLRETGLVPVDEDVQKQTEDQDEAEEKIQV